MPIFGLLLYGALRISGWNAAQLISLAVGLFVLLIVLLRVGAWSLDREEIVARLD
jgi:hypothetical protein